ncbi:hypothetical protein [Methylomonas sp. DH-1]|uniref:hypothetical protein n=1 Tax=Methylomonas sp. (strain DH-1) TaxID=1727196 RepID=UPI0012F6B65D|nr:hypothetical protein [Methylomonas sp. DH-1]
MKILLMVLLLITSLNNCSNEIVHGSVWDNFLTNPNKNAFHKLNPLVANVTEQCSQIYLPSDYQLKQLFNLVRQGNLFALRIGVLIFKCIGTGEQEDFFRSTGSFFEKEPKLFLMTIKNNAVDEQNLRYMVTMTPIDLVDDLDAQISVIKYRIDLLGKIKIKPAINETTTAVSTSLESRLQDFEKIKADQAK